MRHHTGRCEGSVGIGIELVVDPYIDHLEIAILACELIARSQPRESGRGNSKGLAVQPDKIVLEPC